MNWNSNFLSEINYDTSYCQLFPTYYYPDYTNVPYYPVFPQYQYLSSSNSDQNISTIPNQPREQTVIPVMKKKINKAKETVQKLPSQFDKKKNIRNIIPNLSRKILKYLSSEASRQCLISNFPNISKSQIEEYYEYTNIQKNSLNFYIGNKDLKRIWHNSQDDPNFLKYSRFLSKNFLDNCCINSILLSKRMKQSLKVEHLRYRRKLLKMLNTISKQ